MGGSVGANGRARGLRTGIGHLENFVSYIVNYAVLS